MPTHYKGTPAEITALDAFIKFTRASSAFESRLLSHGTLDGLTLSQFGVMEILYHLGSMCQGSLSQKLLKSTGNMTMVLDNLEKHGLVRRIRSVEDRRMVMVELTAAGSALIEKVLPQQIAMIVAEMSVLTPAEQAELGRLSKKLGLGKQAAPLNEPDAWMNNPQPEQPRSSFSGRQDQNGDGSGSLTAGDGSSTVLLGKHGG